jgi:hypothetical protein
MELSIAGALWQAEAPEISLSQTLLLGIALVLLFPIGVYTIGSMAKRLDVEDPEFTQAVWATVIINLGTGLVSGILIGLGLPVGLALFIVLVAFPVTVIKLVYSSTVVQAVLIWIVVGIVEGVCAVALLFGALGLGEWLDERYDLPLQPEAAVGLARAAGVTLAATLRKPVGRNLGHTERKGVAT